MLSEILWPADGGPYGEAMNLATSYVAFATLSDPPLTLAGKLRVPKAAPLGGAPAVLICHGSDGVDGRGEFHAPALQAAGIATLEVDMWAARGTGRGAANRPKVITDTVPDVFGALRFLAAQPEIDPARIGIMGFSWGGVMSLLAATRRYTDALAGEGPRFAAHAAFYPACWNYMPGGPLPLSPMTGAPVLIQTGDADAYDAPDAGEALLACLPADDARHVRVITHKGAGHGFDRDRPTMTINDPYAHNGKGGEVVMAFHREAAEAARTAVVRFFSEALRAEPFA
jgi:dienelactone hydrolase